MYKFFFILTLLSATMSVTSCSNDNDNISEPKAEVTSKIRGVWVKDGHVINSLSRTVFDEANASFALSFDDEGTLYSFQQEISQLDGDSIIELTRKFGVTSLADLEEKADLELDYIDSISTSESEFTALYTDYLKKYEGALLRNTIDTSDLSLYAGTDNLYDLYIANEDGIYVVGGEVITVDTNQLPESIAIASTTTSSSFTNSSTTNTNTTTTLTLSPGKEYNTVTDTSIAGKRFIFTLGRKYNSVELSIQMQKRIYGIYWKYDKYRHVAFECSLSNIKLDTPFATRFGGYYANFHKMYVTKGNSYPVKLTLGNAINNSAVTGKLLYWTDYTMEHDNSGIVIYDKVLNKYIPRCSSSKAKTIEIKLNN